MISRLALVIAGLLVIQSSPLAQQHTHGASATPYAGLQARTIKSLSDEDIAELQRGAGWGLALPAELNGKPGPAHVLELADDLVLSEAQRAEIKKLHTAMKEEALAAGERFIAAEAALSDAFAAEGLSEAQLQVLLATSEKARADLRYVHLVYHLSTPRVLTSAQIEAYNRLRGYADDPCAKVPEGHNAEMWRKHNNCG